MMITKICDREKRQAVTLKGFWVISTVFMIYAHDWFFRAPEAADRLREQRIRSAQRRSNQTPGEVSEHGEGDGEEELHAAERRSEERASRSKQMYVYCALSRACLS